MKNQKTLSLVSHSPNHPPSNASSPLFSVNFHGPFFSFPCLAARLTPGLCGVAPCCIGKHGRKCGPEIGTNRYVLLCMSYFLQMQKIKLSYSKITYFAFICGDL